MHLANITHRPAEVEFYNLLSHLEWQVDYSPHRFQAKLVQEEHSYSHLEKEADKMF